MSLTTPMSRLIERYEVGEDDLKVWLTAKVTSGFEWHSLHDNTTMTYNALDYIYTGELSIRPLSCSITVRSHATINPLGHASQNPIVHTIVVAIAHDELAHAIEYYINAIVTDILSKVRFAPATARPITKTGDAQQKTARPLQDPPSNPGGHHHMTDFIISRLNLSKEWHDIVLNRLRDLEYISNGEGNEEIGSHLDELRNYIATLIEADCGAPPPAGHPNERTFMLRLPLNIRVDEMIAGTGNITYAVVVDDEEQVAFQNLKDAWEDVSNRIFDAAEASLSNRACDYLAEELTKNHLKHIPPPPVKLDVQMHPDAYEAVRNHAVEMGVNPAHYEDDQQLVEHYMTVLACTQAGYLT